MRQSMAVGVDTPSLVVSVIYRSSRKDTKRIRGAPVPREAKGWQPRFTTMMVFLDFEASSLAKHSYPIEVGWAFEDGTSEAYLIRPALGWEEWDPKAQAIHGLSRDTLVNEGTPHDVVAHRMVERLTGHDLLASAPSWDGKWLSILLRAAGLPRHALRLRDSDDAHRECALAILRPVIPAERLEADVTSLLARTEVRGPGEAPAHRALSDAQEERARWLLIRSEAHKLAADYKAA
jgi:hypothetical protein